MKSEETNHGLRFVRTVRGVFLGVAALVLFAPRADAQKLAVKANALATVLVNESNNCSVMQPVNTTFSARYWTYAGAIPTEMRSGTINKDNVQSKLDTFVAAMTAE